MSAKLNKLKEILADQVDEITLLELLEINATDIVEMFSDRIEEKQDKLALEYITDEEEESE